MALRYEDAQDLWRISGWRGWTVPAQAGWTLLRARRRRGCGVRAIGISLSRAVREVVGSPNELGSEINAVGTAPTQGTAEQLGEE